MMWPGLATSAPNFSWGAPPDTTPVACVTLVLPRSLASMVKVPELRLVGTLNVLLKVPYLSAWTEVTAWPGSDARCLMVRSIVARGSKPLPVSSVLGPWRTILGLSRISTPGVTVVGPPSLGCPVGMGGAGAGVGVGILAVLWWVAPLGSTAPEPADRLSMPNT